MNLHGSQNLPRLRENRVCISSNRRSKNSRLESRTLREAEALFLEIYRATGSLSERQAVRDALHGLGAIGGTFCSLGGLG
jgi:hypothetical protein